MAAYDTEVVLRLLIVDPQPLLCEALSMVLALDRSIHVVGATTDEMEATELTRRGHPDVVFTELHLSKGSGLSLARRLQRLAPVIVLTREQPGDVLLDVVGAGAFGCLGHDTDVERLPDHARSALLGRFVADPDGLLDTLRRASEVQKARVSSRSQLDGLTPRQREVLRLLGRGFDDAAIARELHLSRHTVRTHVDRILSRLEVHSRADAARVAVRQFGSPEGSPVLRLTGPDLEGR
jgi:DNA-binding NarL/FixJ family response regulator